VFTAVQSMGSDTWSVRGFLPMRHLDGRRTGSFSEDAIDPVLWADRPNSGGG
jgi:hypothetical protein